MDKSVFEITSDRISLVGTGFIVVNKGSCSYIVTCGHVINDCKDEIYVNGIRANVVKNCYTDGLDLAIISVDGLDGKALPISVPIITGTVDVIGYSTLMGDSKKETIKNVGLKTGVEITKKNGIKINALKLYPGEPISNGYSGSPVICRNLNKVIGFVNIQVGTDTNYAISSKHIMETICSIGIPIDTCETYVCINKKPLKIEDDYAKKIKKKFDEDLESSLQSFSSIKKVWVEPRFHKEEEIGCSVGKKTESVSINDIIDNPRYIIIRARQQFGLTCLSRYLVRKAWAGLLPSLWLYIDANELKPTRLEIEKYLNKKLKNLFLSIEDVECVILDEFSNDIKYASKILKELTSILSGKALIIMWTTLENPILGEDVVLPYGIRFETLHLWSLPRNDVRQVVCGYNETKYIGDENAVVNKVLSDLEVLNIPRTPLNCLTILKVYEAEFDESPVNRTEMIRRVLHLLFNIDEIPNYKVRPDLKDTEYILGYFCEKLIRENKFYFSREEFLSELNKFCNASEIEIETQVIFDVLYINNIIVMRGLGFCFKFSYWIFYFAAHRMHHDTDFAEFILSDMNYTSFPEMIEFYTGIDRRRGNAIHILAKDINLTRILVTEKCGLPLNFEIYDTARWEPSDAHLEEMHEQIANGTLGSNLPDSIKDQYADKSYDRTRPLNQSIHKILENYSLLRLMKALIAGSKALRNSDYADPESRHRLMKEILLGWKEVIKVLIVIAPIMAQKGFASIEGASFALVEEDFWGTPEEKFFQILQMLPSNVVYWYKDDIFTNRMAPLLYKYYEEEENNLLKHTLNLLIITKRPRGWDSHIKNVIFLENKNSFYLGDIYQSLRAEYQYGFVSNSTLMKIGDLIKATAAKHNKGIERPSQKIIKSKAYDGCLPERDELVTLK